MRISGFDSNETVGIVSKEREFKFLSILDEKHVKFPKFDL